MRKVALLATLLTSAACAQTIMPNGRAEGAIATALGEPSAADVHVIERREQWPSTYFTVQTTHHGRRECIVNGGTIDQLGVIYTPACETLRGALSR